MGTQFSVYAEGVSEGVVGVEAVLRTSLQRGKQKNCSIGRTIRANNVAERLFADVKKRSRKMSAPFAEIQETHARPITTPYFYKTLDIPPYRATVRFSQSRCTSKRDLDHCS